MLLLGSISSDCWRATLRSGGWPGLSGKYCGCLWILNEDVEWGLVEVTSLTSLIVLLSSL